MQSPGRFALKHAKLILFIVVVLAILGIRSYTTAPKSMFPAMSFSRIDVVAEAGDLPPEQVRVGVTRPLEAAMQTLPSVLSVRGASSQGSSELIVEFDPKTDPRADLQYVNQAISQTRPSIADAKTIDAVIINPNSEPVVSYALTSKVMSQTVLRQYAELRIIPKLYGVPGLGRLLVAGGPQAEYHVDINPAQLAAVGLSAQDVATAIAEANTVQSVGSGVTHYERYIFLIDSSVKDVASLGRIPIALKNGSTVPLSSIARIQLGVAPLTDQVSFDGQHAILLNAYALPGADATKLAISLSKRLDPMAKAMAPAIAFHKYWDQTRLVIESQKSLRDAILLGALLAVLVIYAFLRNLRMTLVAAAIIPLAMAIAVLILQMSGQSLNLMSVGGLAVAVGLIIDDAIVVIEAIARRFADNPNGDRRTIISDAIGALARPMLASTLTTVVVFVPLALLSGVTGFFFRALAFTLATALIVSWTLATFVTPNLARVLLGRVEKVETSEATGGAHDRYEPLLRWALRHGKIVALGSVAVLLATFFMLMRLPSDFLPSMNEGQFEIRYQMPTGLALGATDAAATAMERIILRDHAVVSEGRMTGIDTNGYSPTQQNTGTIRVRLRPGAQFLDVSARLRDRLNAAVPAATLDFRQIIEDSINDLSGSPSPIEVTIAGPDQSQLILLGTRLANGISKVPGVVDAFNGIVYDDPAIHIAPKASQLASLGLQTSDIAGALSARTQGIVATQLAENVRTVPVRVRVQGDRLAATDAALQPLFTKSGTPALGSAALVGAPQLASEVNDRNGQRLVRVTANLGKGSLSAAISGVKAQIAALHLPAGYTASIGGAYQAQQSSFSQFIMVFGVAVTLVYAVMLATFGSLRLPIVILAAIPPALIGVALALFLTGTPLNVSSFMGMLLLIGIVVKNGILLIDVAHKRRQAGDTVEAALVEAGKQRLRPILMTTLAAIGGLLPLALGIGSGSEMQRPLAIAVIGGLSTATVFTLIVIPVLYRAVLTTRFLRFGASAAAILLAATLLAPSRASAQVVTNAPPAPLVFAGLSLTDAERAAASRSPDVAIAAGSLQVARAQLDRASRTVGLSFNAGYTESPQGNPIGPQIAARITSTAANLSLADVLAHGPAVASAAAKERAATADYANAVRLENVKVIGLYFGALKARAVADARQSAVEQARAQLDAANKRFSAGGAPRLDVVRAQVQAARAESDLALARAADQNALAALETATGIQTLAVGSATVAPQPSVPAIAPAIAQAQQTRGDVRAAKEAVIAEQQALVATQRAAIPPITLSAGYNTGADSGAPIHGPTIGAQVSFPIPSTHRDDVAIQRAQVAQAQARARSVQTTVSSEIANSIRNLSATIEAQHANQDALSAAREELQATETGYQAGASSSLEVTSARTVYDQALVDALSAEYDVVSAHATLEANL